MKKWIAFAGIITFFALFVTSSVFAREVVIKASEYGNKWPFTVSEGTLKCDDGSISFYAHGKNKTYAVNGFAHHMKGYPMIDPIWKNDPNLADIKVSISPILQRGNELCNK